MAQQGIQGGGDRPEPKSEDREAPSAKLMESLGAERVRKEEEANKPAVEKFRETTDSIKDYFAEKMDQARAEMAEGVGVSEFMKEVRTVLHELAEYGEFYPANQVVEQVVNALPFKAADVDVQELHLEVEADQRLAVEDEYKGEVQIIHT